MIFFFFFHYLTSDLDYFLDLCIASFDGELTSSGDERLADGFGLFDLIKSLSWSTSL